MDAAHAKALAILVAKRDQILAQNPRLKAVQAEIDRLLIHAGPAANRGAALEILLAASVQQLRDYAESLRMTPIAAPSSGKPGS